MRCSHDRVLQSCNDFLLCVPKKLTLYDMLFIIFFYAKGSMASPRAGILLLTGWLQLSESTSVGVPVAIAVVIMLVSAVISVEGAIVNNISGVLSNIGFYYF